MGCAIGNGTMLVPGGFIHNTSHFCVHQDPLIPLPGFLVVVSLRHIGSITEMQESEYEEFSTLVKASHQAIKAVTGVKYLTIIQEESSIHFHLWFFPWLDFVIEKYGQPSLTKIREIMFDYRKRTMNESEWAELENTIELIKAQTVYSNG